MLEAGENKMSDWNYGKCSRCGESLRSGSGGSTCPKCAQNEILNRQAKADEKSRAYEVSLREKEMERMERVRREEIKAIKESEERRLYEEAVKEATRKAREFARGVLSDLIIVIKTTEDVGNIPAEIYNLLLGNEVLNNLFIDNFKELGNVFDSDFLSNLKVEMTDYILANPNDADKLKILKENLNNYIIELNSNLEKEKLRAEEIASKKAEEEAELQRKTATERAELKRKAIEEKSLQVQDRLNTLKVGHELTSKSKNCKKCNYSGVMAIESNTSLITKLIRVTLIIVAIMLSGLLILMLVSHIFILSLFVLSLASYCIYKSIKLKTKLICPSCEN